MTTKLRKTLSMALAVLMCFSLLGTSVFAASPEEVHLTALPRPNDTNKTGWGHPPMEFMQGWSAGNSSTFVSKSMDGYDGNIAYCIELGIKLHVDDTLSQTGESFWDNYPESMNSSLAPDDIKAYIGRIMQYGFAGKSDPNWNSENPEHAEEIAEMTATQMLIWETVIGERGDGFVHITAPNGKSNVMDMIAAEHPLHSLIYSHYDRIAASVQEHTRIPSFASDSANNNQSFELKYDGTGYSTTLTDENNVLAGYDFTSVTSGVSFSASGNKLTVSMDEAPTGSVSITAEKKGSTRSGIITWTDGITGKVNNGQIQDLVTYAESVSDPVYGYFNVNASFGGIKITKVSEDGNVAGVSFTVSGNGTTQTVTTDEDGEAIIENLTTGEYLVTESTSSQYVIQESQAVTVKPDEMTPVNFHNILKKWNANITKTDAETGTPQGNATLEGAVYGIYQGEELTDTYTTDQNGQFTTTYYPCGGDWTLREITPSQGYLLDETIYSIGAEAETYTLEHNTIEMSVTEQIIKANIRLTKVDKDYPDDRLTGAEFEVRFDSNKNKALDDEDASVGILTETEPGIYEMPGLAYGGYFVQEIKAPEGYVLDANAYYVAIEENGKTYVVENELGKGFVNPKQTGSLKIIKTSSDGTLEGFSFRITDENGYTETFKTDQNGEILIENLRIGEYTVSEVKDAASEKYVLPKDKTATVLADAVTTVEMHNTIANTRVPQTGGNPSLWFALVCICAAITAGLLTFAGKRGEKHGA